MTDQIKACDNVYCQKKECYGCVDEEIPDFWEE